jgi:multidrug transporter EmrE-like cation transporter
VSLHAPSKGWFVASLITAVIALIGALSPIPYITAYGIWVGLLAYVLLVVGNLAPDFKRH